MAESPAKRSLLPHLPRFIITRARRGEDVAQPFVVPAPGVALILDIAGFVPLTEEFTQQGRRGAERLSTLLDAYFGRMTGIAGAHGGDVIAFTGDGFIAIWSNGPCLEQDTLSAAQCALEIQRALLRLQAELGVALRQRVVIGTGEVLLGAVGGVGGRFHPVAGGSALIEATRYYAFAENSKVLLCPEAYRTLASHCKTLERKEGTAVLVDVLNAMPLAAPAAMPPEEVIETELNCFLPPVTVNRALAGQEAWLAEFRNITVLFVGLPRFGTSGGDDLALLQTATEVVQHAVLQARGNLERVSIEEKGACYLVEFGLPSMSHEDDALRAVCTAMALRDDLRAIGLQPSIGVATGKLFCGSYGGSDRQTYSVIGASVNLAARLMEYAKGSVCCDETTRNSASDRIAFAAPEEVALRGIREAVPVYRALHVTGEEPRRFANIANPMVGRKRELLTVESRMASAARGGLLLLEGEAGIGKSRLLAEAMDIAAARGIPVTLSTGSEIEQATPYFPWRSALRQALGGGDVAALRQAVVALLAEDEIWLDRVALLNDVFPLGFAETNLTREITGAARSSLTQQLLAQILARKARDAPFVLIFDDVQWFDSPSAAVIERLLRGSSPVLVILATRPLTAGALEELAELAARGKCERLVLELLSRDAVETLVAHKLSVRAVPRPLTDFIFERAGGNPLYSEELTLALRTFGFIELDGDICHLPDTGLEGVDLAIPDTLQGAIVSRIDRLAAVEQLTLKVASVIGRRFSIVLLRELHPVAEDLEEVLDRLVARDFVWQDIGLGTAEYLFKHVIVQEVIYDLLLFNQRQALHSKIARSLEATRASGGEVSFAELASHWERAGAIENAMQYLVQASDLALRRYSIREVLAHCRKALALAGQHELALQPPDRARWSAMLADAYQERFDYQTASKYFREALTLLSWPVPRNAVGLAWQIAREVATQCRLRVASPAEGSDRNRFASHIYERLAEIAYFDNRKLELLYGTLASLNRAEEAASTREIVDGYAALSVGLSAAGLRRLAGFYNRRSLDLAETSGAVSDIAYAHLVNMVFCAGLGRWEEVERSGERAAALFLRLGGATRWQQVRATLCYARFTRGAADLAAPVLAELKTALEDRDTPAQVSAWIIGAAISIDAAHGRFEAELAERACRLAGDPLVHRADRLLCLSLAAVVQLRCGNTAGALELGDQALVTLTQSEPTAWHLVGALSGLAETFLLMAEHGGFSRAKRVMIKEKARIACAALRRYSRRIPVAEPRAHLTSARYAALAGHHARARRGQSRALRAAERYDMAEERRLALEWLGDGSASGFSLRELRRFIDRP